MAAIDLNESPAATAATLPGRRSLLLAGSGALLLALPVALAVGAIHAATPDNPERAVMRVALLFAALAAVPPVALLVARRRGATPGGLALAIVSAVAVLLAGAYLFSESSAIFLRADTLIWSEGPFVADILKFRIGYPLYSAPANLDSFFYPPLTQLLTYGIAKLAGFGSSIPAYRVVQLCYAALAALAASAAGWRLLVLARPDKAATLSPWWGALWTPLLFLCATNALTNPFTHALHNDSLSQLVCAVAWLLLVEYAANRRAAVLVALAFLPAIGFGVKQSLVVWAGLITGFLVVFDQPRSPRRAVLWGVAAFALAFAAYRLGRAIWGENFYFWTIADLRDHPFSPLRSLQHALDAWAWFAAGIAAALVLLGGRGAVLWGLWTVWLLLLAQEAWTSGIAWMLNHMGPGSLIAGTWLVAALAVVWPRESGWPFAPQAWLRGALAAAGLVLVFSGLGMVRIPVPALPGDVNRYVAAIEHEFVGVDTARVLLDGGTWVYLPAQIVPKDRSAAVGDLGSSGLGDFSGFLERIRTRHYQRILVRSYGTPELAYDHHLWNRSSGIRAALDSNYREVRTIPAVRGEEDGTPYLRTISVLEPRP